MQLTCLYVTMKISNYKSQEYTMSVSIKELENRIKELEQDTSKDNTDEIIKLKNRIIMLKEYNQKYYQEKTLPKRRGIVKVKAELKVTQVKEEKPKTKVCARCGKEFIPTGSHAKYCPNCREIAMAENRKAYRESERYAEVKAKYQQSEKFKETVRRYHQTEKYKSMRAKYNQSEKAKETRKRYINSVKGMQTKLRYLQRVIENGGEPLGTRNSKKK